MNTVIYHRSDFDGLMSAAICYRALTVGNVKPLMVGWEYGDPVPDVPKGEDLYIVDLSVEGLMDHPNLVWIDHHKTAIDKWDRPGIPGLRIDGVAACRLCWHYFNYEFPCSKEAFVNREVEEPELVRLLGEYDIWDQRDERAAILQLGMRANSVRLDDLILYLGRNFTQQMHSLSSWVSDGRAVEKYVRSTDAGVINSIGYELYFEGLRFIALNADSGNSLNFIGYKRIEEVDACLMWKWNGSKVVVSLYHTPNRKDLDLSVIAKKYGGGGHRGACGFTIDAEQLAEHPRMFIGQFLVGR